MQIINGGYYKIDLEADEVYTLRQTVKEKTK